jgi:hypothetical protein
MRLTGEYLRNILDYDPSSGVFRWRVREDISRKWVGRWNARYAGKVAGNQDWRHGGRVAVSINKRDYFAHRLAFLYMTDRWPSAEVDHRDGDPSNNRWGNLREATSTENKQNKRVQSNNKTGLKGASWKADKGKWRAAIRAGGRHSHLGYFETPEQAHEAYCQAAREHYGEFARLG